MICIKEVRVNLELCVHAHENDVDRLGASYKWLSSYMILSVFLKLIPYSYGSDHAVLIWYIWWEFIIVPRLFLARLKYLLSQVNDPVLLLSCSTFEYYPLVSRRCLAIAPHLTNFVEVMYFLVVITLRVLDFCQPRTLTSKIIPHYKSNTSSIFTGKFWTQSGHS